VHQAAYELVRGSLPPGSEHVLVPNALATNTVLGATDLLVSDYSSIVIDFLVTGRPVVHYVPDLEEYSDQRGLYLTQDELPGPVVSDHHGLVTAVTEAIAAGPTSPRSQQAAARFSGPADGRVSARIVDVVFGGASADAGADYVLKRDFVDPAKETLLIHCGSMKSMGITTSALNLLRNLDYDKYDVTVFWPHIPGRDRAKNIAVVDDRARPLPRALTYIGTRRQVRQETDVAMQRGAANRLNPGHDQFWRTEWQRVFGDARFDHLIDFSGYGCYSPFVFSATEATHRSIWLHSEMVADLDRVIEKHEVDRLSPVFTTYRFFDHLVSVSPQLRDINRLALAAYAPPEKFHYALNTIDGDHILELSTHAFWGDAVFGPPGTSSAPAVDDDEAAAAEHATEQRDEEQDDPEMGETPTTVQELESAENREGGVPSPEDQPGLPGAGDRPHRLRPVREPGTTLFITVGRLSLEKNHVRLVDAFARVHADHPDTRLWIVGGGKLEGTVRERITHHGLDRVVHMTGQVANPYKFMAKADCFVLSSDYEGQPVVILEARVLGLPVISTAFASVGDSIPDGAGLVVPQSVDGVADGMERFLAGEVHAKVLDHHDYNRRAIEQFERAIHGRHGHDDDED
jgi:glycosyltransferase involved in cell wall biosynthesis